MWIIINFSLKGNDFFKAQEKKAVDGDIGIKKPDTEA
jgi:hypothetical protein